MVTNRLPLAITLFSRDGGLTKDARMLNAFKEIDGGLQAQQQAEQDGQPPPATLAIKRPGINTASATSTGAGQGGIGVTGLAFAINGDVMKSYNAAFVLQNTYTL